MYALSRGKNKIWKKNTLSTLPEEMGSDFQNHAFDARDK